jgi:large subunit ribosomal protein L10
MDKQQKALSAKELKKHFSEAKLAIFADYKGLNSNASNELRRSLRAHDIVLKVVKNNVARQALKDGSMGAEATGLLDTVVGPTMIAFAYGDVAAAAKALDKFAKDNEAFGLKPSLMGQKRIEIAEVQELASLPSREVLLAKLLSCINGPARNLVGVVNAVPRSVVQVLAAIEKKKGESQA